MSTPPKDTSQAYLRASENWATSEAQSARKMARAGWMVAGVLGVIALAEAVALASLVPLKTAVPYTLMVDRQTGAVQALKPTEPGLVAPDASLTRAMIAQYVIAREGFDIDSLKDDYRKVALWSSGEARNQYIATMQATNPQSPLARLPRRALLAVEVQSISPLGGASALVRFVTHRTDGTEQSGGQNGSAQVWQAVIGYRFSGAAMSAADRLVNPLGFQVTRYRRDAVLPVYQGGAQP